MVISFWCNGVVAPVFAKHCAPSALDVDVDVEGTSYVLTLGALMLPKRRSSSVTQPHSSPMSTA